MCRGWRATGAAVGTATVETIGDTGAGSKGVRLPKVNHVTHRAAIIGSGTTTTSFIIRVISKPFAKRIPRRIRKDSHKNVNIVTDFHTFIHNYRMISYFKWRMEEGRVGVRVGDRPDAISYFFCCYSCCYCCYCCCCCCRVTATATLTNAFNFQTVKQINRIHIFILL